MIYDNRRLSDGERIRLLCSMERDELDRETLAAQRDPGAVDWLPDEPRRYAPEPSADVPLADLELLDDELYHDSVRAWTTLNNDLSRSLAATRRRTARDRWVARGRYALWVLCRAAAILAAVAVTAAVIGAVGRMLGVL